MACEILVANPLGAGQDRSGVRSRLRGPFPPSQSDVTMAAETVGVAPHYIPIIFNFISLGKGLVHKQTRKNKCKNRFNIFGGRSSQPLCSWYDMIARESVYVCVYFCCATRRQLTWQIAAAGRWPAPPVREAFGRPAPSSRTAGPGTWILPRCLRSWDNTPPPHTHGIIHTV